MAVYSKLLLSAGGGIVSKAQQADQVKNTATVLIGLGGTGIDALRTIKTQVYSRLKADDPDAVVPQYEHIRFLGIDTAEKSKGDQDDEDPDNLKAGSLRALDDTEVFSISNPHVKRIFSNPKGLEMREELSWLRWEDIDAPNLTKEGAGGIRQVGRFMMMDKSAAFMSRVEQEINAAKTELTSPTVNVHIFSGLSGGTGAGCFLDVCYMVRRIANKIGGVTIFGYFFLPDVNLSVIPPSNTRVCEYIPRNGYAAMQELDYCMQLQFNGGSFVQKYQNHIDVEWREPPVDMCHLICATDANNNVIANAYEYAMNVTAEYVMNFLTHSSAKFGLSQHLSNFNAMGSAANGVKDIGSHLAYCVIGASCASIPLREINTYLASELFEKFSCICQNTPVKADVEKLAISALARDAQSISDIYNSVYRELHEGFDDSYAAYADDWKFVRDYGNSQLITSYTNQTAAKLNFAEKNMKSMTFMGNQKSLIGRVDAQLRGLICDISFGPMFAYRLVSAAESHNLLNIIDGLIEENNRRWDQEAAQTTLRQEDYDRAKSDFDNRRKRSLFDTDAKRFGDYEYYLMLVEQHKLAMSCYEKLDQVLTTFRKQVEELTASYYIKLSRVVDTLINTFKENRDALASEKILQAENAFTIPMMTIAELKGTLDAQIQKINVPGMLDAFMRLFLGNEKAWLGEDENKITKLVNTFFVKTAFSGFSNRTITAFLMDKYEISDNAQLANLIYNEWMKKLTDKASPLFYFNSSVWREDQTSKLAFVSIPMSSAPIQAAANQMYSTDNTWVVNGSALTDRIFVMCSACALPLSSYNNCAEYENAYFSSTETGRHYYEGKPVPGMKFDDWRKLPSLTPQSHIDLSRVSDPMKAIIAPAQALYEEITRYRILDHDNRLCRPSAESVAELQKLIDEVNACAATLVKASDAANAQALVEKLRAMDTLPMTATGYAMQNDGYAGKQATKLSVQKDHFVSSPVLQGIAKDILDEMKALRASSDAAQAALQAKIVKITEEGKELHDYCEALFTGIISYQDNRVSFLPDEYSEPMMLSAYDDAFAFMAIPVYQAFVSYRGLLSAETKAAIKQRVYDLFNRGSAQIRAEGARLKAEFTPNKVTGWKRSARSFPEEPEILEFIQKFMQNFDAFCMRNDI